MNSPPHSVANPSPGVVTGLRQDVWDFADLVLKTRFANAMEMGAARYAIYRDLRFAARTDIETLFDELALTMGWQAQRLDAKTLLLDGEGVFISGHGGRKADYLIRLNRKLRMSIPIDAANFSGCLAKAA